MKLHEYQSKRIFAKYGVPIPEGDIATTAIEARQIAQRLGSPVVVKSQVLVGGRGKAGGIKVAKDANEAKALADQILGMAIKGLTEDKVLIDQAAMDIRTRISAVSFTELGFPLCTLKGIPPSLFSSCFTSSISFSS